MRVLLVARHFPPHVSGGARRPYGLYLALKALGHDVDVVAPTLPDDVAGLAVFHPNASPALSGPAAPKISMRDIARETLLLPDPDIRWTLRVVTAVKASDLAAPDWIITTSPPESIHAAGGRLKAHFGCAWLADFRDLWLESPLRESRQKKIRQMREKRIAKRMLRGVDAFAAVDSYIKDEMYAYIDSSVPCGVIPNFAIPSDLLPRDDVIELPKQGRNIVYTGSFSLSDPNREIRPALTSFLEMAQKGDHLHIAGRLTQDEQDCVAKFQLNCQITYHGVVGLSAAMALQEQADILMLYAAPEALAPSGKFHEYCGLNKPIWVVGDGPWRAVVNAAADDLYIMNNLNADIDAQALKNMPQHDSLEFAHRFLALMPLTQ